MGIDYVIESDIVRFLDNEVPKEEKADRDDALIRHRDYIVEIKDLLKRNRVEDAKRVFDDLKTRYVAVPKNHPEEKKKLYSLLQSAYIDIYNFVTDKAHTVALLRKLEQVPDSVFDVNVKPVDIGNHGLSESEKVPEFEPLSIQKFQTLTKEHLGNSELPLGSAQEIKPVPQFDLALPRPPVDASHPIINPAPAPTIMPAATDAFVKEKPVPLFMSASSPSTQVPSSAPIAAPPISPPPNVPFEKPNLFTPPAPSTPLSPPIMSQVSKPTSHAAPVQTIERVSDPATRDTIRSLLRRAFSVATSAPNRCAMLIDEIRNRLDRLSESDRALTEERIKLLEDAVARNTDRIMFTKKFSDRLTQLTALARMKSEDAIKAYESLANEVETFDKAQPNSIETCKAQLETVRKQYSLYTEETLVEQVKPYLKRLVSTPHGSKERKAASDELQRFIHSLPKNKHGEVLQHFLESQKKPLITTSKVDIFVQRLRAAKMRRDRRAFDETIRELSSYVQQFPDTPEKKQLEQTITALVKK